MRHRHTINRSAGFTSNKIQTPGEAVINGRLVEKR